MPPNKKLSLLLKFEGYLFFDKVERVWFKMNLWIIRVRLLIRCKIIRKITNFYEFFLIQEIIDPGGS